MIETYKILTQKYDPEVSNFIKLREDSITRGHKYKIFKSRPRLDIRKYSFCVRVVETWNQLPSVKCCGSRNSSSIRKETRSTLEEPTDILQLQRGSKPTGHNPRNLKKIDLELTQQVEPDLLSEEDL